MTPERAREVLLKMPTISLSDHHLTNTLDLIRSGSGEFDDSGNEKIRIDGYFTADQLEAIAVWMRDPVSVSSGL